MRDLREQRGWSQAQLAERADLDITYVSGIERGRRNPGLTVLDDLARAFGLPLPLLVTNLQAPRHKKPHPGRPPKRSQSRLG